MLVPLAYSCILSIDELQIGQIGQLDKEGMCDIFCAWYLPSSFLVAARKKPVTGLEHQVLYLVCTTAGCQREGAKLQQVPSRVEGETSPEVQQAPQTTTQQQRQADTAKAR